MRGDVVKDSGATQAHTNGFVDQKAPIDIYIYSVSWIIVVASLLDGWPTRKLAVFHHRVVSLTVLYLHNDPLQAIWQSL